MILQWQEYGGQAVTQWKADSELRRDSGHPRRHIRKLKEIMSKKVFTVQSMENESS